MVYFYSMVILNITSSTLTKNKAGNITTILSFIISSGTNHHDNRWTHGCFKDLCGKFIYSNIEHWCLDHELCLREIHYFKFDFVSGSKGGRIHLTFLESSLTPSRHFVLSVPFSFFSPILSICSSTCLFHRIR